MDVEYSEAYPNGKLSYMFEGPKTVVRLIPKNKRNELCKCGSLIKYKKCCGRSKCN